MEMQYRVLFPFEKVSLGSKVLIYGAGRTGRHYLMQMLITNYSKVVGMIDRNYEKYNDYVVPVYPFDKIKDLEYDYIVVAATAFKYYESILNNLREMDVPENKVVFVGERPNVSYSKNEVQNDDLKFRDFSLMSGERQTGENLNLIRHDHLVRYELVANFLSNKIDFNPVGGGVGLDCFCGVGYGSFLISEKLKSANILGIDASSEAIAFANLHYSNPKLLFSNKYYPFDLPKETFDFIISFESVEHIEDGCGLLSSLIEALKPNGYLFFSIPNENVIPLSVNKYNFHYKHYTMEELKKFLAGKMTIEKWYGQNTYQISDGKTGDLLDDNEMELVENVEAQDLIFICKKC